MSIAMIEPITEEGEPLTEPRVAAGTTATTIEELLEHFTEMYVDDRCKAGGRLGHGATKCVYRGGRSHWLPRLD